MSLLDVYPFFWSILNSNRCVLFCSGGTREVPQQLQPYLEVVIGRYPYIRFLQFHPACQLLKMGWQIPTNNQNEWNKKGGLRFHGFTRKSYSFTTRNLVNFSRTFSTSEIIETGWSWWLIIDLRTWPVLTSSQCFDLAFLFQLHRPGSLLGEGYALHAKQLCLPWNKGIPKLSWTTSLRIL